MLKKIIYSVSLCALSSFSFASQEDNEDRFTVIPKELVCRIFSEAVFDEDLKLKGLEHLVESDFLDKVRSYILVSKAVRNALLIYKDKPFSFIPREPIFPEDLFFKSEGKLQPINAFYVDAFLSDPLSGLQLEILNSRELNLGRLSYANEEDCAQIQPKGFYIQNCLEDLKGFFEGHEYLDFISNHINTMNKEDIYKTYRLFTNIMKSNDELEDPFQMQIYPS
ncbi:MAG: hypothetical protein GY915_03900 [bacterium]|nr:hypothetical protein [bacterium]